MRVLVVYGTKNGSTASIATRIANAITAQGIDVDLVPTPTAADVRKYGAVIVGGIAIVGVSFRAVATMFPKVTTDKHVPLLHR